MQYIFRYLRAPPKEIHRRFAELLHVSTINNQVCNAGLCAQEYLPPLFKSHGHLMELHERNELRDTLKRYAPKIATVGYDGCSFE